MLERGWMNIINYGRVEHPHINLTKLKQQSDSTFNKNKKHNRAMKNENKLTTDERDTNVS